MIAAVHVVLHLGLFSCVPPTAQSFPESVHVTMTDHAGHNEVDRVLKVTPINFGNQLAADFDVPPNLYKLRIDVPEYNCGVTDFVDILSDHTISEEILHAPVPAPDPVMFIDGSAPLSWDDPSTTKPHPGFAVYPMDQGCDQPISQAYPEHFEADVESGTYYVGLDPRTASGPGSLMVVLTLQTPTRATYYVRLPIQYPEPWSGWPTTVRFDITDDMIASLITEKTPTATLLCPKTWKAKVG